MATITGAKRRNLTLIEVLLVLSIIVMLGGVVGINVRGAMAEQNFRNDVQTVVEQLRLSQELMLIAGIDVEVSFKAGVMYFHSEDKIDPRIDRTIKKAIPLKHIVELTLDGQPDPKIAFMSRGSVMTAGTLILKSKNEEKRIIAFLGAPGPIQAGTSNTKEHPSWDPLIEVTRFEIAPPTPNAA